MARLPHCVSSLPMAFDFNSLLLSFIPLFVAVMMIRVGLSGMIKGS